MKERPILFSGEMVRALQRAENPKTQTRRIVVPQPEISEKGHLMGEWLRRPLDGLILPKLHDIAIHCPYGVPGDRLWVRETHLAYGRWETRFSAKKGRDEWHFVDMTLACDRAYQYAADAPDVPLADNRSGVLPGWWRRPAIFMPRWASRITLEVTGVRVERLQEIDWEDAIAEGIRDPRRAAWRVDPVEGCVAKYRELWDSLNAERGHGWDTNPWVWVVEFRRITG